MNTRTTVFTGLALAGLGVALITGVGGPAAGGIASATPSSTITVQDQGGKDGAAVDTDGTNGTIDTDGTVGDFKQATDGNAAGPIMVATPQMHAGK